MDNDIFARSTEIRIDEWLFEFDQHSLSLTLEQYFNELLHAIYYAEQTRHYSHINIAVNYYFSIFWG